MEESRNISRFQTFSVLALAISWVFEIAVIGPILGELSKSYPNASVLLIQNVMTAPYFTGILASLAAGKLAKHFDKKKIAITGLLIYGVTGIIPSFASDIYMILVLRLITGIGAGLVMPMTNAMISDFFSGKAREKMFGLAGTVNNAAAVIMSIFIGAVMAISWKISFYSFAVIFVVAFIAIIGLPNDPPTKQAQTEINTKKEKIPGIVYLYAVFMALCLIFVNFGITNASFVLTNEIPSTGVIIGLSLSFPGLFGAIAGAIFPSFKKLTRRGFEPVSLLIYAIGFVMFLTAKSVAPFLLGLCITGLGEGLLVPQLLTLTAERCTNQAQKDMSLALVSACFTLGFCLSPFVQSLLLLFKPATSSSNMKYLALISIVALVAASVISAIVKFNKKPVLQNSEIK